MAFRLARARRKPTVEPVTRLAVRLISLRRFEEAEALVRRGLELAPHDPHLLEQLAFCAHNAGRYQVALERWGVLCALRPDLPMPWCGVASNARELLQLDEADAAMKEALSRFPDDLVVISEAARVAESCGAVAAAVDLWMRMLEHSTVYDDSRRNLARNLMKLRRFDEVEQVLEELTASGDPGIARRAAALAWGEIAQSAAAMKRAELVLFMSEAELRFGDDAYAAPQLADTKDDLSGARDTLRRLLDRAPGDTAARESYVRVLVRSDLVDDAEREIETGLRSAPDHEGLGVLRGLIAMRRQDWDTAQAISAAYLKAHPGDWTAVCVADRISRVRQLDVAERTGDVARPVPFDPEICDDPEVRRLLLGFESIGADCEFGSVQRRYGAEPLGLLRWTDTDIPSLMAATTAQFDGIGDPAHTELTVGPLGEIYIRDTRWHLAMHTFLSETEVSLAALLPKMCKRTAYLRDKFIEDLRGGEKTLVFKSENVDVSQLVALHDAFVAFGPVRLLHVRLASGGQDFGADEQGNVRAIRPGLFVGRISRVSQLANLAYDEWVAICRATERLRLGCEAPASGEELSSAA